MYDKTIICLLTDTRAKDLDMYTKQILKNTYWKTYLTSQFTSNIYDNQAQFIDYNVSKKFTRCGIFIAAVCLMFVYCNTCERRNTQFKRFAAFENKLSIFFFFFAVKSSVGHI
jgi:hypothetical protein